MSTNPFSQPAQARFINTYVPIPFEQLYNVANQFNQELRRQEAILQADREKYGTFLSRSEKDMQTYNDLVYEPAKALGKKIADNPDYLKTPEGRSEIQSMINSRDYGLLSQLKQNAVMLDEAWKNYDPRWQDGTYEDITNWDTSTKGLWDRQMLPYQTVKQLTDIYFNDLKPVVDRSTLNKPWLRYSISPQDLSETADRAINEIYQLPEIQKHIQNARNNGLIPNGMSDLEYAKNMVVQSQRERLFEDVKPNTVLQHQEDMMLRQRIAAMRGGNGNTDINYPPVTTSDAIKADLNARTVNQLQNPNLFRLYNSTYERIAPAMVANTRHLNDTALKLQQARNNNDKAAVKRYTEHMNIYANRLNKAARLLHDAQKKDLKNIYIDENKVNPDNFTSKTADIYVKGANNFIDRISIPVQDQQFLNDMREQTSQGKVSISVNASAPTEGFVYTNMKNLTPVVSFVSEAIDSPNMRLKTDSNIDFDKAFKKINNSVSIPTGNTITKIDNNGESRSYEKMLTYVRVRDLKEYGIDKDFLEDNGFKIYNNISARYINKKSAKNIEGVDTSWGSYTDDSKRATLTGEWVEIQTLSEIPFSGTVVTRSNSLDWRSKAGTTYSADNQIYADDRGYSNIK